MMEEKDTSDLRRVAQEMAMRFSKAKKTEAQEKLFRAQSRKKGNNRLETEEESKSAKDLSPTTKIISPSSLTDDEERSARKPLDLMSMWASDSSPDEDKKNMLKAQIGTPLSMRRNLVTIAAETPKAKQQPQAAKNQEVLVLDAKLIEQQRRDVGTSLISKHLAKIEKEKPATPLAMATAVPTANSISTSTPSGKTSNQTFTYPTTTATPKAATKSSNLSDSSPSEETNSNAQTARAQGEVTDMDGDEVNEDLLPVEGTLLANSVGANVRVLWRNKEFVRMHYAAMHVPWSCVKVLRDKANEKKGNGELMMMTIELSSLKRGDDHLFPEDFDEVFGTLFNESFIPLVHEKFNGKGIIAESLLPREIARAYKLLVLSNRLGATLVEDVQKYLERKIDECKLSHCPPIQSPSYQIIVASLEFEASTSEHSKPEEKIQAKAIETLIGKLPNSLDALEDLIEKSCLRNRPDMATRLFRKSTQHALDSSKKRFESELNERGEKMLQEVHAALSGHEEERLQLDPVTKFLSGASRSLMKNIETSICMQHVAALGAGFCQGILLNKVGMGSFGGARIVRTESNRIRWRKPGKFHENKGLEKQNIVAISAVDGDSTRRAFRISSLYHGLVTFRAESEEVRDHCVSALQRWWRTPSSAALQAPPSASSTGSRTTVSRAGKKNPLSLSALRKKLRTHSHGSLRTLSSARSEYSDWTTDEDDLVDCENQGSCTINSASTRSHTRSGLGKHVESIKGWVSKKGSTTDAPPLNVSAPVLTQSSSQQYPVLHSIQHVSPSGTLSSHRQGMVEPHSSGSAGIHQPASAERKLDEPVSSVLSEPGTGSTGRSTKPETLENYSPPTKHESRTPPQYKELGALVPPPASLLQKAKSARLRERAFKPSSFKRWKFLSGSLRSIKSSRSEEEGAYSEDEVEDEYLEADSALNLVRTGGPVANASGML